MKRYIAILTLVVLCATTAVAQELSDSLYHHFDEVEISASLKGTTTRYAPVTATTLSLRGLENRGVGSIKDISTLAPNFYQPDYGSSITSSIYVRGFGSRIDQPVLGLTIDNIPVMNKNAFDFDFYDIRRVELLRGPQGTLYGRNTSGGVMNITTLSPMVWQGLRAMVERSTINSYRASASYYAKPTEGFGYSLAVGYNHDGGHFTNHYNGTLCDDGDSASARLRLQGVKGLWRFDNTLTVGYTAEGGYAYHHLQPQTGIVEEVAYNDPSSYERLNISEGFVASYTTPTLDLSTITSYQYLDDCMTLDQDFSTRSMFTMQQMQREHTLTQEVVVRNKPHRLWQGITGAFLFGKWLDMSSPVTFKEDGINDLILGNINNGIHNVFPDSNMLFGTNEFVIESLFAIPTYGAALYHQSSVELGNWSLVAGLRLDYEYATMEYNSFASVPYRFDMTMPDFKEFRTEFKGRERQHFFEILPKLSAEYTTPIGDIYATISRGYKTGGYNTQIFSDILQSKMMTDMMADLGIELDSAQGATSYDTAEATKYKPETSWNFEIGAHLSPAEGLNLDGAIYWIECFDQQVTVLPKGKNTGRMMSNAARARSFGIEFSADYTLKGLNLRADYGYTNAKFREYDDGVQNYRGRFLPYAPQNTVALLASYTFTIQNETLKQVTLSADYRGIGDIYWNETNSLKQSYYSLLGAQIALRLNAVTLAVWGKNLLNTDYNTFYFKSVGEEFYSKGLPLQVGLRLSLNL